MLIRPTPVRFTCTNCSWSKRVAPNSDVLSPGDYFHRCPKCLSPVKINADLLALVLGQVNQIFHVKII